MEITRNRPIFQCYILTTTSSVARTAAEPALRSPNVDVALRRQSSARSKEAPVVSSVPKRVELACLGVNIYTYITDWAQYVGFNPNAHALSQVIISIVSIGPRLASILGRF